MKKTGPIVLTAAGVVLATIALRAKDPTYRAPRDSGSPATVPFELTGEVPAGFVVRHFDVEGMCCEGCPGKLFASVTKVDGVKDAAVDSDLGRVDVLARGDVDVSRLRDALSFGEYSATYRQSDASGHP